MRPFSAWIVSLLSGGAFFFFAQRSNLFEERNVFTLYGLIVATFMVSYFIALAWTDRPWRWAIPIILGVLTGDGAAIPRDLAKDSTSHNMWPMELALLAAAVSVCALAGAFTGAHLAKRVLKQRETQATAT